MKAQEILERLENITKKYFSTSEAKIEYIFYLFSRKHTKEIVFPYESDKETNKVHLCSGCSAGPRPLTPVGPVYSAFPMSR